MSQTLSEQTSCPNEYDDVTALLHQHATILLNMKFVLGHAKEALENEYPSHDSSFERRTLSAAVEEGVLQLRRGLEDLLKVLGNSREERRIPGELWRAISDSHRKLCVCGTESALRPYVSRLVAREIADVLSSLRIEHKAGLPRKPTKEVARKARALEVLVSLADVDLAMSRIEEMDNESKSLRLLSTSVSRAQSSGDKIEEQARCVTSQHEDHVWELAWELNTLMDRRAADLMCLRQVIEHTMRTLSTSSSQDVEHSPGTAYCERCCAYADSLAKALGKLSGINADVPEKHSLQEEYIETLLALAERLSSYRSRATDAETQVGLLRSYASKVRVTLGPVRPSIRHEIGTIVRGIEDVAGKLERLVCVRDLHELRLRVVNLDHERRAVRRGHGPRLRTNAERSAFSIQEMVEDARKGVASFAQSRRIDFRCKGRSDTCIVVDRAEIVRALTDILHNAVKYNYQLPADGKNAWVDWEITVDSRFVSVIVDSWGVPVTQREIAEDKVFQKGYIGEFARDHVARIRQQGTGVGLWDARAIARKHGGDVFLDSYPARWWVREGNYDCAYLTHVTLKIPRSD